MWHHESEAYYGFGSYKCIKFSTKIGRNLLRKIIHIGVNN